LDEARSNLEEAIALVLEANRALAAEELGGAEVYREPLTIYCASIPASLRPKEERPAPKGWADRGRVAQIGIEPMSRVAAPRRRLGKAVPHSSKARLP